MLTLTPIETVRDETKTPIVQGWGKVVSDLVFDERYTEGLDGIEDYSHVLVLFWLGEAGPPKSLKGHVQGHGDLRVAGLALGVNHLVLILLVSVLYLLFIAIRTSCVQGLDAIDGTPVLDIKPCTPAFDRVENARVPEWCKRVYEVEDYF